MPKPVRLRARADRDLSQAIAHYTAEGGVDLAERFLDAIAAARDHLRTFPSTGSLHFAIETGIADLRSWPVGRFPYLILSLDREAQVDVVRILHARRDIPATLAGEGGL